MAIAPQTQLYEHMPIPASNAPTPDILGHAKPSDNQLAHAAAGDSFWRRLWLRVWFLIRARWPQ
jgi:hypothetical protein